MRILCWILLTAGGLFAGWEEVRAIPAAHKVQIHVRKGEPAKGAFVSASDTAVLVRNKLGERSIARDQIRKVEIADPSRRLRNGLVGTAIGVGVGLAIGWAVCPYCANEGHGDLYTGPGAAIGAGVGAAAGFLPPPYRTIYKSK
jgi:hypothetical protein